MRGAAPAVCFKAARCCLTVTAAHLPASACHQLAPIHPALGTASAIYVNHTKALHCALIAETDIEYPDHCKAAASHACAALQPALKVASFTAYSHVPACSDGGAI